MNNLRNGIVDLLHKNKNKYISGQKISHRLGVSRTTISNHIKRLCEKDYKIEAKTNKGYKLLKVPENLVAEEISYDLETDFIGQNIKCYSKLSSTNVKTKKLADRGDKNDLPPGTLVITEQQTAGKGRRGRKWYSPPKKGLWFSIILYPDLEPEKVPLMTMIAVLAVQKSLEEYCNIKPQIKWPNDVLICEKKLAGILSEVSAEIDKINHVIVGIGINVNQVSFPEELAQKAISLRQVTTKKIDRIKLLKKILKNFEARYYQLTSGNADKIINCWKNNLKIMNKQVTIEKKGESYQGNVIDISPRGELILKDNKEQILTFWSGDTTLIRESR